MKRDSLGWTIFSLSLMIVGSIGGFIFGTEWAMNWRFVESNYSLDHVSTIEISTPYGYPYCRQLRIRNKKAIEFIPIMEAGNCPKEPVDNFVKRDDPYCWNETKPIPLNESTGFRRIRTKFTYHNLKETKMKIRHGDVLIETVDTLPESKKLDRKWLFEGEATGHAHRIDVGEIFETRDGQLYLRVEELTHVSHEEHKTIMLPKGIYRVTQKRQYVPDGTWAPVMD